MIECLNGYLGLTESPCECITDKGAEWETLNASTTGRYITDADGGFPLLDAVYSSIDCNSPNNIVGALGKAKASAMMNFATDLSTAIATRRAKSKTFEGTVGRPILKPVLQLGTNNQYAGIELFLPNSKGLTLVIDKVLSAFPSVGSYDITVWSNDPTFVPITRTITNGSQAITENELAEPIVLPFWSNAMASENGIIYRIYYPVTENPFGTELWCCGGSPSYNSHFWARGFQWPTEPTNKADCTIANSSYSMGLVLSGRTVCDATGWICDTKEIAGYDLAGLVADALRYKAAIYLAKFVLDTTNVNAYTLLSRDAVYGLLKSYNKAYENTINWIAQNVPSNSIDCLGCEKGKLQLQIKKL